MDSRADFELQIGKETTFGTAVTPTAVLWGVRGFNAKPERNVKFFRSPRNNAPAAVKKMASIAASGQVEGEMCYEQMDYLLESLLGVVSASGAGPYTRTYDAAVTGKVTSPRIMTMRYASSNLGYEMSGAMGKSLSLEWAKNEALKYTLPLIGYDVTAASREALSQPATITPIMSNEFTLYIDPLGTYGTTEIAAALWSASLSIDPRRELVHHVTSKNASGHRETGDDEGWDVKLTLKLEVTSAVKTILDNMISDTDGYDCSVRLDGVDGDNGFRVDFPGFSQMPAEVFQWEDGIASINMELTAAYEDTLGTFLEIETNNLVATLA